MSLLKKLGLENKKKVEVKKNRATRRAEAKFERRAGHKMEQFADKMKHNTKRDNNLRKIEKRHEANRQASAKRRANK